MKSKSFEQHKIIKYSNRFNPEHFPYHFYINRQVLRIHNYLTLHNETIPNIEKKAQFIFNHKLPNYIILDAKEEGFTIVEKINKSQLKFQAVFDSIVKNQLIITNDPFTFINLSPKPSQDIWWNGKFHFGFKDIVCTLNKNQIQAYDIPTKTQKYTIENVQYVLSLGETLLTYTKEEEKIILQSVYDIFTGQKRHDFQNLFYLPCEEMPLNQGFTYQAKSDVLELRDFKKNEVLHTYNLRAWITEKLRVSVTPNRVITVEVCHFEIFDLDTQVILKSEYYQKDIFGKLFNILCYRDFLYLSYTNYLDLNSCEIILKRENEIVLTNNYVIEGGMNVLKFA